MIRRWTEIKLIEDIDYRQRCREIHMLSVSRPLDQIADYRQTSAKTWGLTAVAIGRVVAESTTHEGAQGKGLASVPEAHRADPDPRVSDHDRRHGWQVSTTS